jgi:hypothetical protein
MSIFCDNCDAEISELPEGMGLSADHDRLVHTRTGSPECKDEWGRLLGSMAEPAEL